MLYPKEDRDAMALIYKCRTCNYSEPATSYCVYRNQLSSSAGETAGVTTDVGSDPTLPRSSRVCPACSEMECVFFQSQLRKEETKMVAPPPPPFALLPLSASHISLCVSKLNRVQNRNFFTYAAPVDTSLSRSRKEYV